MTAYRLLLLPGVVWRGLRDRLEAARAEMADDLGPVSLVVAAATATASMGRVLALLPRAGELDERGTDELAGACCAVLRDVRRLLQGLGRGCY